MLVFLSISLLEPFISRKQHTLQSPSIVKTNVLQTIANNYLHNPQSFQASKFVDIFGPILVNTGAHGESSIHSSHTGAHEKSSIHSSLISWQEHMRNFRLNSSPKPIYWRLDNSLLVINVTQQSANGTSRKDMNHSIIQ